jgi:hypothetical protein
MGQRLKPSCGAEERICAVLAGEGDKLFGQVSTYFWTQRKTLFTFKSMTLLKVFSGVLSNDAPQEAPAFANKMSTWSVCLATSATKRSTSDGLAMSAGTEMALPEKGSALRAAHASSQAAALRDVMKTFEAPAWMRLLIVSSEY